jgi:mono/diheme cytochrome c family protein
MKVRACGISILVLGAAVLSTTEARQTGSPASLRKAKGESVYSEISKAPEKARVKRNPLEKDPEAPAAGRILFEQHCAECHGDNAEGGKKAPSLRAAEIQTAEPGAIFWVLTNGVVRKGMPVWSKLPEPQRWQLVSFIKSLGIPHTKAEISPAGGPQPLSATDSSSRRR